MAATTSGQVKTLLSFNKMTLLFLLLFLCEMRGLTVSQKVFIVAMTTCTIVTFLNTNIYAPKLNFVDV